MSYNNYYIDYSKSHIQKKSILIILFALCFSLISCESEGKAEPQFQDEVYVDESIVPENIDSESTPSSIDIGASRDILGSEDVVDTKDKVISEDIVDLEDILNSEDIVDSEVLVGSEDILNSEVLVDSEAPIEAEKFEVPIASESPEIIFEVVSDIVYAISNVNIRTSYSTEEDNIISVLKKGDSLERNGITKEWSKVLYQEEVCYIKSEYLSLEKPVEATPIPQIPDNTGDATNVNGSFVSDLSIAEEINQLICVIGNGGSDCTVSFHVKDSEGTWFEQFSIDGDNGSKGINYDKREGDLKTPAGLYPLSFAFGIKSDPGALLSYRKITENDYWIADASSPDYNTWVNSEGVPEVSDFEHLIEHNPSYTYVLNIDYNVERTPGLGSAIFLHCYNGKGRTTGCVAISEKYMKLLIQELDSSAMILIVPNIDDLANY
ncbi:MAG TPA: L,D-transpeptidase family protein [Mobilitalea sp.]|nr:L,D-transpeptidase family protein [Mobilitalea sp.]